MTKLEILKIISGSLILIYMVLKYKKSLHILQLNHYDNSRFYKWIKNNIKNPKEQSVVLTLPLMYFNNQEIIMILISIYLIYSIIKELKIESKVPIVYTYRVFRLIITTLFINMGFIVMVSNITLLVIFYVLLFVTNSFAFISNFVNKPVEKLIKNSYIKLTKDKIKSIENIDVIGITGSFGKTSTKNILYEILSTTYSVSKTPFSYNTPMGISKAVNEKIMKINDYFICEMGAYREFEIKELTDIVVPKYGIITSIGEQHLETFKTLNNIIKTKFELIENLPPDGVGFINIDNQYIRNYQIKNSCEIVTFGIEQNANYMVKNIKIFNMKTYFDIYYNGEYLLSLESSLLGRHNIYNILSAASLAHYLKVPNESIKFAITKLKSTPHRLEVKKYNNLVVLDDAFNSNPVGSKNAIDVLSSFSGKKYIITPGMVDLGVKQYELNNIFGKYIKDVCNVVILVGKKQTAPIYDGLNGFLGEIVVANNFKEAISAFYRLYRGEEAVLLIENDLPDNYSE